MERCQVGARQTGSPAQKMIVSVWLVEPNANHKGQYDVLLRSVSDGIKASLKE